MPFFAKQASLGILSDNRPFARSVLIAVSLMLIPLVVLLTTGCGGDNGGEAAAPEAKIKELGDLAIDYLIAEALTPEKINEVRDTLSTSGEASKDAIKKIAALEAEEESSDEKPAETLATLLTSEELSKKPLDVPLVQLARAEALAQAIESLRPGETVDEAADETAKQTPADRIRAFMAEEEQLEKDLKENEKGPGPLVDEMRRRSITDLLDEDSPTELVWDTARIATNEAIYAQVKNAVGTLEKADKEKNKPLVEKIDAIARRDMWQPPASLDEIIDANEWTDMPVVDSLQLLREYQALPENQALCTVEEALAMRNNSDEDNKKILSALGRLPKNKDEVDWDAEMVRHVPSDIQALNPFIASSTTDFEVSSLVGFGLFSFDWNFEPFAVADTVVSWQASADKMYDVVVLRDDLVWSDGKPITAHDVEFSYKMILTAAVPATTFRTGTDQMKWVKAYDDRTVVFFHKQPLPTNVWNINYPIAAKHVFEKSVFEDPKLNRSKHHVEQNGIKAVVGGAYKVVGRTPNSEIVLERREDYYMHDGRQVRDKPYFKTVRLKIIPEPSTALMELRSGDIDEMMLTADQWQSQTNSSAFYRFNTKASGTEWVYFYFGWNCKTPFFEDKRVRQAMSYAVDYDELLNVILYGLNEQSMGIFHPDSKWYPGEPVRETYRQDYDKAKQLLDEAGWKDTNGDGYRDKMIDGRLKTFEFSMLVSNNPVRVQIAEDFQRAVRRLGIRCKVRPVEFTTLIQKSRNHEFQAFFGGWGTGTDPVTAENIWMTGEGRNYGEYSNAEVDRLFKEGRREFDEQKRIEAYGKIHNILYEESPYTFLYVRNSHYAFSKDLRGYMFSPRGPYSYGPGFGSLWKPKKK